MANPGTEDIPATAPVAPAAESPSYVVGQSEVGASDRPVCVVFRDVAPDAKPALAARKKVSHSPGM